MMRSPASETPAKRETLEEPSRSRLTSGRVLARGAALNLLGQGLPFLAALVALPLLAAGLGTERFGVLALAWVLVGYVSLFDLGLGRALTQLVAERLGRDQEEGLPALVWTALLLMGGLGLAGAGALALAAPWLARVALGVTGALAGETSVGLVLIAVAIPFVTIAAGLRGVLEAHQRFGLVNAVRIPMSSLSYLGPLALLSISPTLAWPIGFLLVERVATALIYLALCRRVMPSLRQPIVIAPGNWLRLLRFGGWMTVTNIVGPLMVYFDRFLIGGMLSVAAVAYYSTPYDFVTRLLVIPGALAGVLFPAFAIAARQDLARASVLFLRSTKFVFMLLWPLTLVVVAFAFEILDLWMGREFAMAGTSAMRWLAVGVLLNGLAQIPFALIQGHGRPDLTAKLHLAEVPLYLLGLWWLIDHFGITGAAMAWTFRVIFDTGLLFLIGGKMARMPLSKLRSLGVVLGVGVAMLAAASYLPDLASRVVACLALLTAFAIASMRLIWAEGLHQPWRAWLGVRAKS